MERFVHRIGMQQAVAGGAETVVGGTLTHDPSGEGWFYPPTVLERVTNDMPIAREELSGPVLSVLRSSDDTEALAIANDSPFGLAAGVWSRDLNRAHRMAAELEAGTVWVNTYHSLSYASPFGGRKLSGHGRELGSEGLREFTQSKSVWIDTSESPMGDPFTLR